MCFLVSGAVGTLYKEVLFFLHMKPSCLSGYVPPAPLASPRAETPSGVSQLGLLPLLFPALQVVRSRGGGFDMHLVFCPGGLPPLPLDLGPARGVGVLLDYCLLRASTLSLRLLLRELAKGELLDRSGLFLCPLYSSVDFHHSSPHVRRRGELWKPSEDRYRVLSSRGFRSSDRGARVDKRALRERGRSSDRYRSRRVRSRLRGDRYRFSDRYRSCRGRSRCAWSRSFDCYQSHRSACVFPARR